MPRLDAEIVIVGGGLLAAVSAAALADEGFAVLWLGGEDSPRWRGPGPLAIAPAGRALLERHRLWPGAPPEGQPVERMRVWDASGAIRFDAAELGVPELARIVDGVRLYETALAAARATLAVEAGEIATVEPTAEAVRLVLADGRRRLARLLVACDGADSPLRRMLGIPAVERDYGARALTFRVKGSLPHQATAYQRFLPGGPIALLPLADGSSQVVWSAPESTAHRLSGLGVEALAQAATEASERCLGTLRVDEPGRALPLRMRLAERFAAERVALLGDAAHQVHPLAGQGANLGLLDLAWLLATLGRAHRRGLDLGGAAVLASYACNRRSDAGLAALAFDGLERLFAPAEGALVGLRRVGLALVDRLPALKRWLAREAMGWSAWPAQLSLPGPGA
jgi:2-octaprenyl-3-methyl-6-methoxy-1,4-benzoquinol hydroxylase/2-octaprenylphenol hydroxylase